MIAAHGDGATDAATGSLVLPSIVRASTPADLLRSSVGLENVGALIGDIEDALHGIRAHSSLGHRARPVTTAGLARTGTDDQKDVLMLMRATAATLLISLGSVAADLAVAHPTARGPGLVLAAGPSTSTKSPDAPSSEEKMQRRYPQPVKVSDLVGLPVLDDHDRTLGRVKGVVRTPSGKIQLIVPYGGFLGWRQRLIAVPIEVVGIAGRQLAALDMTRAEFDVAPAWNDPESQPIPTSEVIRIGLYRR
jgi:hypothetical protein